MIVIVFFSSIIIEPADIVKSELTECGQCHWWFLIELINLSI